MKEIIYLDTEILNSMLAQLDEGLINSFSLEQSSQESETEGQQSTRGKNAGLKGAVSVSSGVLPGGGLRLDSSIGNNGTESKNESRTFLEGQKDILNKAFHDYALDLLTFKLTENELISHGPSLQEGDLYIGESSFRFYDFSLLKHSMDHEFMNELLLSDVNQYEMDYKEAKRIANKTNPTAKERESLEVARTIVNTYDGAKPIIHVFKQLNSLSNFASRLLEDLSLIKADNKIGLLKKRFLRESPEALSFRTDKSRKVKYLIRVIGKKEFVYDGSNIPNIRENEIDMIPNMMLDVILGSFKIIKKGDYIVTPIAIYYE